MGVDSRRGGVKLGDELPLFDRGQILLAFDYDDFVFPYGVFEGLDIGVWPKVSMSVLRMGKVYVLSV